MDLPYGVYLLSPFLGLLTFVVAHVLISRRAPTLPRPRAIAGGLLTGFGVVAALGVSFAWREAASRSPADQWGTAAVWGLTYLSLAYFYGFGFYNLGESARRIRLLIELRGSGDRGMTLDEILAVYNARMIVEARLQRLLSGGQVVEREGRYFVGRPLMLYGAKALVLLKLLFLRAKSEFGSRSANAESRNTGSVSPRSGSGHALRH